MSPASGVLLLFSCCCCCCCGCIIILFTNTFRHHLNVISSITTTAPRKVPVIHSTETEIEIEDFSIANSEFVAIHIFSIIYNLCIHLSILVVDKQVIGLLLFIASQSSANIYKSKFE